MPNSIFANARAAALSVRLPGAERLNRMADCSSAEDAVKILQEAGFGEGAASSDPETLIAAEERSFAAFVRDAAPDGRVARFLLARWDFANAEAVMRAKYLKRDAKTMAGTEGVYPLALLEEKIFADDYKPFSPQLAKALAEADAMFVGGTATGRRVGTLFARAQYAEEAETAQKERSLKEIAALRADAANIGIALRARNARIAAEMEVPGGTLTKRELEALAQEGADTIREIFRRSPRRELIACALEDFTAGRALLSLERAADGAALSVLKRERYSDEGMRPFLRYCFERLAEIGNVRIILSCLANGADRAVLRARMREML